MLVQLCNKTWLLNSVSLKRRSSTGKQYYCLIISLTFKVQLTISMVLEDIFCSFIYYPSTTSPPILPHVHIRFYPSNWRVVGCLHKAMASTKRRPYINTLAVLTTSDKDRPHWTQLSPGMEAEYHRVPLFLQNSLFSEHFTSSLACGNHVHG